MPELPIRGPQLSELRIPDGFVRSVDTRANRYTHVVDVSQRHEDGVCGKTHRVAV